MSYNPLDFNPSGIVYFGNIGPDQIFESKDNFIFDSGNNFLGINNSNPEYTIDASGTGNFLAIRFPDGTIQITAASGVGGSGTIDGSGDPYQIAIWLDNDTISGNDNLVYINGSGLSGLSFITNTIFFDTGLNISNFSGDEILQVNNTQDTVILDIQNSSGNSLFTVNNFETGIILQIENSSGEVLFTFSDNGTYSGNSIIFGDGTEQTTAYTGSSSTSYIWNIQDGSGNSGTVNNDDTIYFSGIDGISVIYDSINNIISFSGASITTSGSGGGSGTINGSGNQNQITFWLNETNITGSNDLIYIDGSGLSGLNIVTNSIVFDTGLVISNLSGNNVAIINDDSGILTLKNISGNNGYVFDIQNTSGNSILYVDDIDDGTIFQIENISGNPIFYVNNDNNETIFQIENSVGDPLFTFNISGTYSGNSIIFGDGTEQTTAYTGGVIGGGGTPGGSDTQVQYNDNGSFSGDPNFTWDSSTSTLNISGTVTATTKSFLINHPTKSGYKLRYGSLEGPENGVYVRGTSNEEFIYLPDHWSGLVHEDSITVNLTPIGKFQQLYTKEKNDTYIVVGGVNGAYDYIVYAERKDIDKLVVEESNG